MKNSEITIQDKLIEIILNAKTTDDLYKKLYSDPDKLNAWPENQNTEKEKIIRMVYDLDEYSAIDNSLKNKTPKELLDYSFEQLQIEKQKEDSYSRWLARKIALPFIAVSKSIAIAVGCTEMFVGALGAGLGYMSYKTKQKLLGKDSAKIGNYMGPGIALATHGFVLADKAKNSSVLPQPNVNAKTNKFKATHNKIQSITK